MNDVTTLRAALWSNGYRPVAVCSHDTAAGRSPGKRPVGLEWERRARLNPPQAAISPATAGAANTGAMADGLRAIDVDFADPIMAAELLDLAIRMLGAAPVRTRSNSGKFLALYRAAEGEPAKRSLVAMDGKVEVLGLGQQAVIYGTHVTGVPLEWVGGSPLTVPRDDLPAVTEDQVTAFLDAALAITGPAVARSASADARTSTFGLTGDILDIASAVGAIPNADSADWNFWVDIGLAIWGATEGSEEGFDVWLAWSEQHPSFDYAALEERWEHFRQSPPTKAGVGKLIHLARDADPAWRQPSRSSGGTEFAALPDDPAAAPKRGGNLDATEDGLALAFCDEQQGRAAYDHTARTWWRWDAERWTRDARGRLFNQAREFVRGVRETGGGDASLARIATAKHVEEASRSDPRMAIDQSVWDRDPMLLGVPGGVVDLRTGDLRPNKPGLYIGRQTAVAPAARGSAAPVWSRFLAEATQGDDDLQAFLQRLAGYMLTGDVSEEKMAFLHGPGGNGKGVFLGALLDIMADYAVVVPIGVFTVNSRENPEYYRARMAGARVVTASETEAGAEWAESQIKELTGNEAPISARSPYGQPFEFRAQFKLVIVGNHTPRTKGRSPAMERRLRIIPFVHRPDTPDTGLKDKLRAEHPAILRWALDGCAAWQRDGLGTARAIAAATGDYFDSQDTVVQWAADRCDLDADQSGTPAALYADFAAWLRGNGGALVTTADFRPMVERLPGIRRVTVQGKAIVRGIGLRPADDSLAALVA